MMWEDPIVKEVRKVREAYAARFDYDLLAIYHDLKQQEKDSRRLFVSYAPRRVVHDKKAGTERGRAAQHGVQPAPIPALCIAAERPRKT